MDTPVDRLLDALRVSGLNPSAEALARMVDYVSHNGMTGKIPINEHLSLLLHPEAIYPESCPGSDVITVQVGSHVRCDAPDCGQIIERYWDGVQYRKVRHNRPTVNA